MSRLISVAFCATLLASACKVERTPPEYIDHQDPIALVRDAAAEELQARLLAMGQALNRGDLSEAVEALSPTNEAYVLTPDQEAVLTGEEQISGALDRFASAQGPVRIQDVVVTVGPRANVAWFRARLEHQEVADGGPFRFTGVYLRGDEGEWRLVQAHLSSATAPPDSLAPDSLLPSPAAGASPPAGG